MLFSSLNPLVLLHLTLTTALALQAPTAPNAALTPLLPRGSCSQGVSQCCGTGSVSCSNGVCKACCGDRCGCFYERGGTCSSDPSVTPCVNV